MSTMTVSVPGISCGHCVAGIGSAVRALRGVTSVDVDLTSKQVHVEGNADEGDVLAAIADAGYDVA